MNELLRAEALHKIYNKDTKPLHVLKGVSLVLAKGEVLSVAGPSGAGKSTLLHILGGLDRPERGRVFVGGADLYSLHDAARAEIRNRRIGFVFQFYHLLPEFSALENVMLPVLIKRGQSGRHNRAKDEAYGLLKAVGLERRALHKPPQLSGGERQRVAIARALVNNPEILLCDEPTGNLDSKTSAEVCDLLWRLNDERKNAMIIVTHEKEIARRAGRVIYMRDGLFTEE